MIRIDARAPLLTPASHATETTPATGAEIATPSVKIETDDAKTDETIEEQKKIPDERTHQDAANTASPASRTNEEIAHQAATGRRAKRQVNEPREVGGLHQLSKQ